MTAEVDSCGGFQTSNGVGRVVSDVDTCGGSPYFCPDGVDRERGRGSRTQVVEPKTPSEVVELEDPSVREVLPSDYCPGLLDDDHGLVRQVSGPLTRRNRWW